MGLAGLLRGVSGLYARFRYGCFILCRLGGGVPEDWKLVIAEET